MEDWPGFNVNEAKEGFLPEFFPKGWLGRSKEEAAVF